MICENCLNQNECKEIKNIYEVFCQNYTPDLPTITKWRNLKDGDIIYYVTQEHLKCFKVYETRILKQKSFKRDANDVDIEIRVSKLGVYNISKSQLKLFHFSKDEVINCLSNKKDCKRIKFIAFENETNQVTAEDIDYLF